jgi:hypothetical protein
MAQYRTVVLARHIVMHVHQCVAYMHGGLPASAAGVGLEVSRCRQDLALVFGFGNLDFLFNFACFFFTDRTYSSKSIQNGVLAIRNG